VFDPEGDKNIGVRSVDRPAGSRAGGSADTRRRR